MDSKGQAECLFSKLNIGEKFEVKRPKGAKGESKQFEKIEITCEVEGVPESGMYNFRVIGTKERGFFQGIVPCVRI